MTRWASASHAQPRIQSSAQRVTPHRPCIRGCPTVTHHSSQTSGRHTLAHMGDTTPPCGVPLSGERSTPASSPPAWSHVPLRRHSPPLLHPLLHTRPELAPVEGGETSPAIGLHSPGAVQLPTLLTQLVERWGLTRPRPAARGQRLPVRLEDGCQDPHDRPLAPLVLQAGCPSGPLLARFFLDPPPLDRRRHLPMVAPPRMPLVPVLVQMLRGLRRRHLGQAWGTALAGLVRGCQPALLRHQVPHGVAHHGRIVLGLLGH